MPGLVPGIHALLATKVDVDGRDKPGHDSGDIVHSSEGGDPYSVCHRETAAYESRVSLTLARDDNCQCK
jgi:hypothetical protein